MDLEESMMGKQVYIYWSTKNSKMNMIINKINFMLDVYYRMFLLKGVDAIY